MAEARLQATSTELGAAKAAATSAAGQLAQSQAAALLLQGQLADMRKQLEAEQQRADTDAQVVAIGFKSVTEAVKEEHCLALDALKRRYEEQLVGLTQSLAHAQEAHTCKDEAVQAAKDLCTELQGGLLAAQEECARSQTALNQQAADVTTQQQQQACAALEEGRRLREQLASAEQAHLQEVEALQQKLQEAAAGKMLLEEQLAQVYRTKAVAGSPTASAQEQQATRGQEVTAWQAAGGAADDGGWWIGGEQEPAQDESSSELRRLRGELAQVQEQLAASEEAARERDMEQSEKLELQQLVQEARQERIDELEGQLGREKWEAGREVEAVEAKLAALQQQHQELREQMAKKESKRVARGGQQKTSAAQKRVNAQYGLEAIPLAKRNKKG